MTPLPALAVCGSNLTGDVPFSCALRLGDRLVAAHSAAGTRGDLAALVQSLCRDAGVPPDGIAEVRVDVGPGSYTGLRVAVTFVRFLQQFGGASVLALDSLALLAARGAGAGVPRVHALLDARRQRVHLQGFDVGDGSLRPAAPALALPLAEALARLHEGDVVMVPALLPAAILEPLQAAGLRVMAAAAIVAAEMFAPGLPFVAASASDLEPRYLMGSYAEP